MNVTREQAIMRNLKEIMIMPEHVNRSESEDVSAQ